MIVVDASPLIFLGRLGLLDLLPALFGEVLVSHQVFEEATAAGPRPGAQAVVRARDAGCFAVVEVLQGAELEILSEVVDPGEASAIRLALERGAHRIGMDDRAGRALASARGLAPMGSLGVLVLGCRQGRIPELGTCLDALKRAGLRMTPALRQRVEELARMDPTA